MSWFSKLKIGGKLATSFAVVIAIFMAVVATDFVVANRAGSAKLNTAESGKAAPMGEDRARCDRSRANEQTTAPQPLSGIQGQGGHRGLGG
jgi:hypothetical protein